MKKIPTIFERDWNGDRSLVTREPNPSADWVFRGDGTPTRKWDGTCCLIREGKLFKRYELRSGRTAPAGFEAAQEMDPETGKQPGWVPVGEGPEDAAHRQGLEQLGMIDPNRRCLDNATCELCGPKVQGNPEGFTYHHLIPHGIHVL